MTLLIITRLDIQGTEKEMIINTNDILSIEPEDDEAIVQTSKHSFPISKCTYDYIKELVLDNKI